MTRYILIPPNLAAFAGLAIDTLDPGPLESAFPGMAGVRVTLDEDSDYCTVEASDGMASAVWTTPVEPLVDGHRPEAKFPDVAGAIPSGKPLIQLSLDVRRFAALLLAARAVCVSGFDFGDCVRPVQLEVYPPGANRLAPGQPSPLVIRGQTFHGGTFVGLLQPLAPKARKS